MKDLDQGHQRQPAEGTQHPPCRSLVRSDLADRKLHLPVTPPWYQRKYYVINSCKSPNYIKFREKGKILGRRENWSKELGRKAKNGL